MKNIFLMNQDAISQAFFAIIELENSKVIGLLEDPPHEVDSSGNVRLQSPLEFIVKPQDQGKNAIIFLIPEEGAIPVDHIFYGVDNVKVVVGEKSTFVFKYIECLKSLASRQDLGLSLSFGVATREQLKVTNKQQPQPSR